MNPDRNNSRTDPNERDPNNNRLEGQSSSPNDLPDSDHDRDRLRPEETVINLPDVKDIPGQEFVNVAPLDGIGDTTISSDDEEGTSVFDRDGSEDLRSGNDADVRRDERVALSDTDYMPTRDEDNLRRASMDNSDFQGEGLNERGFGQERSGEDLQTEGTP